MTRAMFGRQVIALLQRGNAEDTQRAIEWLEENLTEAALEGCHKCGSQPKNEPDAACWWCGLRDKPKAAP